MFIISEAAGKIAGKLNLPALIGYITAGIVCGPYVLGWFGQMLVEQDLQFFREFALSIIAFSIGGTLQYAELKRLRSSLAWITLFQTSMAAILVFGAIWWLLPFTTATAFEVHHVLAVALILAAVSAATDPATVLSLIDQYGGGDSFKAALLGIVAIDDVIAILFYAVGFALVGSILLETDGGVALTLGRAMFAVLTEAAIGLTVGLVVAQSLIFFADYRSMLGLILGIITAVTGFCLSIGISPLFTSMVLGFMVTNVSKQELADEAMEVIHTIQQPVFGVFFFMAGAYLNIMLALASFGSALLLSISRFAGKYLGTLIGGRVSATDKALTRSLGLALLPAAGVMIGLTMNASDSFGAVLGESGELMVSIVIGATLLNQVLTPFFVRAAINRSK